MALSDLGGQMIITLASLIALPWFSNDLLLQLARNSQLQTLSPQQQEQEEQQLLQDIDLRCGKKSTHKGEWMEILIGRSSILIEPKIVNMTLTSNSHLQLRMSLQEGEEAR